MELWYHVCSLEQYNGEWVPNNLIEAIAWLQEKLCEVPEDYRASATIEISSDCSYDSSHATLEINYRRPETAEEEHKRLLYDQNSIAQRRADEIRKARETLTKYGEQ
jgi:hypothetical protein